MPPLENERKGENQTIQKGERDIERDVEPLGYSKRPRESRLVQESIPSNHGPSSTLVEGTTSNSNLSNFSVCPSNSTFVFLH